MSAPRLAPSNLPADRFSASTFCYLDRSSGLVIGARRYTYEAQGALYDLDVYADGVVFKFNTRQSTPHPIHFAIARRYRGELAK